MVPEAFMASAELKVPVGNKPRLVRVPLLQLKAWLFPLGSSERPTTTPALLIARASLYEPPNVPRSVMVPLL